MAHTYEIKTKSGWHPTALAFFRSFAGERRMDGEPYRGPVYFLGSDTVSRTEPNPLTTAANQ